MAALQALALEWQTRFDALREVALALRVVVEEILLMGGGAERKGARREAHGLFEEVSTLLREGFRLVELLKGSTVRYVVVAVVLLKLVRVALQIRRRLLRVALRSALLAAVAVAPKAIGAASRRAAVLEERRAQGEGGRADRSSTAAALVRHGPRLTREVATLVRANWILARRLAGLLRAVLPEASGDTLRLLRGVKTLVSRLLSDGQRPLSAATAR